MDYILCPINNTLEEENIPHLTLDIHKVTTSSNLESITKERLLDSNNLIPSSILLWRKEKTSEQWISGHCLIRQIRVNCLFS